jgi:hypothetical protein
MPNNRKRIIVFIAFFVLFAAILVTGVCVFPRLVEWVETSERYYESVTDAFGTDSIPEFLPRSARAIHIITDVDNVHVWMKLMADGEIVLDSTLYEALEPSKSNLKIIGPPALFWWAADWRHRVEEFQSDMNGIRIMVPVRGSWWPDDLRLQEPDINLLGRKYKLYRSAGPYKLHGFARTAVTARYTVVIFNKETNEVYVWIEFGA